MTPGGMPLGAVAGRDGTAALAVTPSRETRPAPVPVLELDRVVKAYPGSPPVRALDRVSVAVAAGELTAVAGPSGSGKSTLLHLMGTLDRPTSGTVRVTGLDVARMAGRQLAALRAAGIGFLFQQFFLAEYQTVLGNVADGLLYAGTARTARLRLAMDALARVGLRRALGATRGQIRTQFLSEAILLALAGGAAGVILGAAATAIYAHAKGWAVVIPPEAWAGGLAAALLIGALAGLLPAIRAARLSPTQALWSL
jgi:putative ABC transport system ATP-binding protein